MLCVLAATLDESGAKDPQRRQGQLHSAYSAVSRCAVQAAMSRSRTEIMGRLQRVGHRRQQEWGAYSALVTAVSRNEAPTAPWLAPGLVRQPPDSPFTAPSQGVGRPRCFGPRWRRWNFLRRRLWTLTRDGRE